ncbi:MAG: FAD-dependent oxidoreductase [Alphaproteobacteria bacterium]|nr:MAG: FAD-dependent oxidoreductase [Alphaproteobacteria bacterium]
MPGNDRYAILFEPVQIGPVTAKNRFYQVPHCNGLGHLRPRAEAAMRGMKAAGGWAVVSTQETEIHPSSDLSPYPEQRIWDASDIPALRRMTEAVHEHGALAAIQLVHNGHHARNHLSRAPILGVRDMIGVASYPRQARAMDKADIRAFRGWHRAAALRAREAGFDIVYAYAAHNMTILQHFLSARMNDRTDEYGGSLENRARLLREVLEETREAVGDTCAVALRFAVDEMMGADGMQAHEEGRAVVEMLAGLPDLWDVNVSGWENDSVTSRFEPQDGYQIPYIEFVKQVTTRPVVATGRLNSPDLMVSLVRRGIVDFIGAARPSIADPFLPEKIRTGRIDEIRECIGCNVCVSCDSLTVPIRCTQNPTMGEEWRRGWHPERIAPADEPRAVLVIGGGPAGLECAMQLARRGYEVTLAEAESELGGRALKESRLHGLAAWRRVVDHRLFDLRQRANVRLFTDSRLTAADVAETGIADVFLATGAAWRRDGRGRSAMTPLDLDPALPVFTPDDVLDGRLPAPGPVMIFDDELGYLGGVLAEHLAVAGQRVIFVTSAAMVSPYTELTLEQSRVQRALIEAGVEIVTGHRLVSTSGQGALLHCVHSGRERHMACGAVLMVTERLRDVTLHEELQTMAGRFRTLTLIGDAAAPGLIADAVWDGHRAAREFDAGDGGGSFFRRELVLGEG